MPRIIHKKAVKDCTRISSLCDGISGGRKIAKKPILSDKWSEISCGLCVRAYSNGVPERCHLIWDCKCPKRPELRLVKG